MSEVTVTRTFDAPSADLWALLRDFGHVPWIPGGEHAKVEGDGPGMTRVFAGPDGAVVERLESLDDDARTLVYTIPEGVPFPVTGYRATMRVGDDGAKGHLTWSCEFEPAGVSEADARKTVETMYGVMMGWMQDTLSG